MAKAKANANGAKVVKEQLEAADQLLQIKDRALDSVKSQLLVAKDTAARLVEEVAAKQHLDAQVSQLLVRQADATGSYKDYEASVVGLQLQGLMHRHAVMDVESLAEEAGWLREECMRLTQENMQLQESLSGASMTTVRETARVSLAMEALARERFEAMHDTVREELAGALDDKMRCMVAEHGSLQDAVAGIGKQTTALDAQYRMLTRERQKYRLNAAVNASMSDMQAQQVAIMRRQLSQAYRAVEVLRARLQAQESQLQAAADANARPGRGFKSMPGARVNMNSPTGMPSQYQQQQKEDGVMGQSAGDDGGPAGGGFDDYDEEVEVLVLRAALRQAHARAERAAAAREKWRARSLLYEKACSQLQSELAACRQTPAAGSLQRVWSTRPQQEDSAMSCSGLSDEMTFSALPAGMSTCSASSKGSSGGAKMLGAAAARVGSARPATAAAGGAGKQLDATLPLSRPWTTACHGHGKGQQSVGGIPPHEGVSGSWEVGSMAAAVAAGGGGGGRVAAVGTGASAARVRGLVGGVHTAEELYGVEEGVYDDDQHEEAEHREEHRGVPGEGDGSSEHRQGDGYTGMEADGQKLAAGNPAVRGASAEAADGRGASAVPLSRLFDTSPQPYKVLTCVHKDLPGWPTSVQVVSKSTNVPLQYGQPLVNAGTAQASSLALAAALMGAHAGSVDGSSSRPRPVTAGGFGSSSLVGRMRPGSVKSHHSPLTQSLSNSPLSSSSRTLSLIQPPRRSGATAGPGAAAGQQGGRPHTAQGAAADEWSAWQASRAHDAVAAANSIAALSGSLRKRMEATTRHHVSDPWVSADPNGLVESVRVHAGEAGAADLNHTSQHRAHAQCSSSNSSNVRSDTDSDGERLENHGADVELLNTVHTTRSVGHSGKELASGNQPIIPDHLRSVSPPGGALYMRGSAGEEALRLAGPAGVMGGDIQGCIMGPCTVTRPAGLMGGPMSMGGLRRPLSSFEKLHSPDAMFRQAGSGGGGGSKAACSGRR